MTTHYIPYFTMRQGARSQYAVCGIYVEVKAHNNEPTCPECQAWLEQDAAERAVEEADDVLAEKAGA